MIIYVCLFCIFLFQLSSVSLAFHSSGWNFFSRSSLIRLNAKSKETNQQRSEFSRIINAQKIPIRGGECRLLANEQERIAIGKRLQCIQGIKKLSANVSLTWEDQQSIRVSGAFEIHLPICLNINDKNLDISDLDEELESDVTQMLQNYENKNDDDDDDDEELDESIVQTSEITPNETIIETISHSFDTLLLYDPSDLSGNRFLDDRRYEDQVPANGNIDVGAIVIDYLTLYIFS